MSANAGTERTRIQGEERRQALVEDLDWLIETGETDREAVAHRLGFTSWITLHKALHRIGVSTYYCGRLPAQESQTYRKQHYSIHW